ncbi:acyl--CoA ligase [Reichenbachiella agarivorans]|uniref:Acyl--CoA ligase n=1 Tax=Reichenbachiella agarivorans TaxID=2979464 RepID=A0ABY6CR92_9BACT|nr:class I adenylate-forming enzyme family protein [Reichenbachiella agarivorans]UXP33041.1 acyl--CoA ligase [Reichenbachiella agarivorans]
MYHIYQSLIASADQYPDQIAIIDERGELTYGNLLTQVNALKNNLTKQNIGTGMTVGILTANNRDFVICMYAALASGAVVMPIFHQQKPQEIVKATEEAGLHVIISDRVERLQILDERAFSVGEKEVYYFARLNRTVEENLVQHFPNPAFIRFTSGTTGEAKGVVVSHEAVLERIQAANEALQITPEDRILWVFPMAYHFMVSIVLYLANAATIVINNDFMAEEIIRSIVTHQVTFFYCSPMHLKLLTTYESARPMPSLQRVVSTTTGVSAAVCTAFQEKYQLPVHQAFGIIEIGLPIVNKANAALYPDAVGLPLSAYEVKILDESGHELPPNSIGRLGIKGPGMFSGYLKSPRSKEELLESGFFMTGDLAVMDDSGIVTIKGRDKDVIIVHGNKAFPTEIEQVINTYPEIKMSRAFGQAHPLLGEIVVAEVIAAVPIESEKLIAHCRKQLSSFKVPQRIMQVERIEMTGSGKIKRVF